MDVLNRNGKNGNRGKGCVRFCAVARNHIWNPLESLDFGAISRHTATTLWLRAGCWQP